MNPLWEVLARRFPLVPRSRPCCHRLDTRIRQVAELADAARHGPHAALTKAAEAHNLAALIASDCGLPILAEDLCWTQHGLFASTRPLDLPVAKLALQPLINLGRLQLRGGCGAAAYQLIQSLFDALTHRTTVRIGQRMIDLGGLTRTSDDHRDLTHWMWTVLLTDGTRALAQAGRWSEALHHVEVHHGIGTRLLDGRQIAINAHHAAGRRETARRLLAETITPEPWEQAVAAALAVLNGCSDTTAMIDRYFALGYSPPQQVVFRVRLGLTILDLTHPTSAPAIAQAIDNDILRTADAYAARAAHIHRKHAVFTTNGPALAELLRGSWLGRGTIPIPLMDHLTTSTATAETTIATLLAMPDGGTRFSAGQDDE